VAPAQPTERSASVSGPPVLRPIAMPALKGLSFLTGRSRSAPPVPRDGNGRPTHSIQPTTPETDDEKVKAEATYASVEEKIVVDIPAAPAPAYLAPSVATHSASVASRSTSPGLSLSEALLRARRPATAHSPGANPAKGTRFKSSPLGVADHVLRLGEHQQQQQQAQARVSEEPKNVDGGGSKKASGSASPVTGARAGAGVEL